MTDTEGPGADDPSAAHRLPYTVEPHRYELHLAPDLGAARFTGEVHIDATAHEAVSEIVLHAAELTVTSVSLSQGAGAAFGASAVVDEETEHLTLRLDAPLVPGPLRVSVGFAGTLNDKLHGFYRSTFADGDGATRTIATTQFEATDARRAFPCFDEPDRKAVFSISLDVPDGLAAFSNGPAVSEEALPGGGRRVRFGETIPMSTYLVAFVVGPLEATEPVDARGTPIRVVHTPGKGHLAGFALEVARHAIEFFSDWFAIPYPAEKLDLLAIPDFAFGAMENLGCVTFRESALLVDPERASRPELERIADVVAHEIAHMWFGDLVTMKWWTGIWLNEAFATLMELFCVDAFRPEWERWVTFGRERDMAMATDALHATRPVEYPVGPPEEAQGMFDVLTYQKGASVLRMLERYIGAEPFRAGIRRYLDTHRLGNTETSDLWDAIEAASGEPVRAIMGTWILQGGFPLVSVAASSSGGVVISQEPFALGPVPPSGPSAIGSRWQVPVLARRVGGGAGSGPEVKALLSGSSLTLAFADEGGGGGPVVVNAGGSGFYRVAYSDAHVVELAGNLDGLSALERFNLFGDTWAAVVSGPSPLGGFLVLAESLSGDDPDVWAQVTGPLGLLDLVLDAARPELAGYTRRILGPVLERLGWEPRAGDGDRTPALRAQVIGALGTIGEDDAVAARAHALHVGAADGGPPLPPDLAAAVLAVVAYRGGDEEYGAFVDRYRRPATPQEELRYLMALAGFRQPELAARTFDLARSEVRTQNAPFLIQQLLASRSNGPDTWARVTAHWDELLARFPANIVPRMLDGIRSLCRDRDVAASAADFLAAHQLPGGQRTIDQIVERLFVNVAFASRMADEARPALEAGRERLGPE